MGSSIKEKIGDFLQSLRRLNYKQILEFQLSGRPYLQSVPYWTAAAIVGVVAVIFSGLFSLAVYLPQLILETNPYILFLTSPICFFFATWIVEKYAKPAGGTGVPQVIHALSLKAPEQQTEIDRYLNLRVAVVIVASSLLCVLGAGGLGREGPVVHIAACLFYFVGRHFTQLSPYREHRSWIMAGGAAGVAAAFNAPLAGVVFVLEELAQQHFHQFKTAVISAAIIGGMISQWLSGKYLYFGYPNIGPVSFSAVPWAIFVGVMCGLFAFPFQKMLTSKWRDRFRLHLNTRLKIAVFTGLCMAALANFVGPGTIGGGMSVIEELLFHDGRASWSLVLGRLFGPVLSHLSGCAGGFLAPSLALGATIGSKLSTLVSYENHNLLVLVGMTAFLSANLRAPFTAWVIVMEMTGSHHTIFSLMVASLAGHATLEFLLDRKKFMRIPPVEPPPGSPSKGGS